MMPNTGSRDLFAAMHKARGPRARLQAVRHRFHGRRVFRRQRIVTKKLAQRWMMRLPLPMAISGAIPAASHAATFAALK